MITLRSVYENHIPRADLVSYLYQLLKERTPEQSISHKGMPTLREHTSFVKRAPYSAWYVIHNSVSNVGMTYLTHQHEIGIFVEKSMQRRGYAEQAVRLLMTLHPCERYLWNVNPANEPSIRLAQKLGGRILQHTYQL